MCAQVTVMNQERPPFVSVFRPRNHFDINSKKEENFQEWRKKNIERMKRAKNGHMRLYEYSVKPVAVHQR